MALSAEPDKLDPTLARTLVGRTVFNAICEKLYDVDASSTVVPQLAAALPEFSADGLTVTIKLRTGVKFADGTSLDAAAVKTSLDRAQDAAGSARAANCPGRRACGHRPVHRRHQAEAPFTPLTAVLADRAGMIMSPTALKNERRRNFATNPVCVGPFKFASRVAQDRIEVVKDPNYYDAAKVHLDGVVYKIIADAATRFNNLRSGDVEVLDTVAATDVDALKAETKLQLLTSDSLGYQGITLNLGNVDGVGKRPGKLPPPGRPIATDAARPPGVRDEPRPRRDQQGRLPGPVRAGLRPDQPGQPVLADAAQACPKHDAAAAKAAAQPGRREDAGEDRAWSSATPRTTPGSGRRSRPRSRRAASTWSCSRPSSPPRSTRPTPASTRSSRSAGQAGSTRTATSPTSSARRVAEHQRLRQPRRWTR